MCPAAVFRMTIFLINSDAMIRLLLVGFGGFIGTLARYWLSGIVAKRYGETFPLGTLLVNLVGCFFVGFLFHVFYERALISPTLRTAMFIGLLGGFTTFSSYGLQTFTLVRDGEIGFAFLNIAASNVLGLALVWLGFMLAKAVS